MPWLLMHLLIMHLLIRHLLIMFWLLLIRLALLRRERSLEIELGSKSRIPLRDSSSA